MIFFDVAVFAALSITAAVTQTIVVACAVTAADAFPVISAITTAVAAAITLTL